MKGYLLDTNIVSLFLRNDISVANRLLEVASQDIAISVVTRAEMLYGLAKKPDALRARRLAVAFLAHARTEPWDVNAANAYARLRTDMEAKGLSLAALDMMIAAHAVARGMVLVSADRAFQRLPGVSVEDWSRP